MLRLGTLLVVAVVFRFISSAQFQYGGEVERLKRSPPYCPPYFYHQHPRHFPPPPPRFWPPPPPYYQGQQNYQEPQNFHEQHSFQEQQNENQVQPNQQPSFQQKEHSQAYSDTNSQAKTQDGPGEIAIPEKASCDKCDKGQNTAVSNAKSVTGSAVAVAIAGKGNKR